MQYWVDFQASRQVKDQAERVKANMALRELRENLVHQTRRDLTLNLVNSLTADRSWQTWFWFNHFNLFSQNLMRGRCCSLMCLVPLMGP